MLRAASGLVWIGAASAVPTQRRALHPYDHCTPTDPSFAVLCQSIEDTFNFDTPQADKTACEAAGTCTWVPPPESAGYAPEVGSACDTAGMTSHCSNSAGVTGVEACFACVRRYGFAENAGGDCTEEDVNDFCINGNNPCDTFDCGGYAEGHCSPLMSLTDDAAAIAACRAVVQSGGWGSDPDADRLKCNNAGLLQTGRTGTLCEYFPGALRGVCEWAPGDAGPTCRCEEHWRSELGHLGGPCTERCTGNEDASAQTGCRTTALPTNVGEIGDEQGNMFDASIMACVAGVRSLLVAPCIRADALLLLCMDGLLARRSHNRPTLAPPGSAPPMSTLRTPKIGTLKKACMIWINNSATSSQTSPWGFSASTSHARPSLRILSKSRVPTKQIFKYAQKPSTPVSVIA